MKKIKTSGVQSNLLLATSLQNLSRFLMDAMSLFSVSCIAEVDKD
jgi:hypothetical protein